MKQSYLKHTHISSRTRLFDLRLKEVWEYKDLIYLFVKRSITVSYKQTILGPLWLIVNPLMTTIIYIVLFGNIARLSTEGSPQILFYLSSNAIWTYFSSCTATISSTFTSNAGLFGKVYFPRLTVPISTVFTNLFKFIIQLGLLFCITTYYIIFHSYSVTWIYWIYVPLVLLQLGLLGMGIGIIISSLTAKYRDLNILVTFGMTLWMYITPVVYPISAISGSLKTILLLNPVTCSMELFRYSVLGVGTISGWNLLYSILLTALIVLTGLIVFNQAERTFMDTV